MMKKMLYYKLFLKVFLKIKNEQTNVISLNYFETTTRLYKFTNLTRNKSVKKQGESCQKKLIEILCYTFKTCALTSSKSETSLIEKNFINFTQKAKHIRILDAYIKLRIKDLKIKQEQAHNSTQAKNFYYETQNYEQSRISSKLPSMY